MVMVPPSVVALPLKLLVFVMIDGWHLLVESLLRGAA
jgi:flagellar biosynthetic protein FliP